ncbi:glutaminase A [Caenispirillum bisanense]|uniref:glutaminase A n=1 Tax=Caenispirillum bisanense TaxID=414052 RepID=UPI0031CF291A
MPVRWGKDEGLTALREPTAAPPRQPLARFLEDCHRRFGRDTSGRVADYIPELSKADPARFGIALATIDGHVHEVGDTGVPFTIQSVSKAFVFALALELGGPELVEATIGVEPSGEAFNSIRLRADNRPFNPMVNAGAMACSGLVHRLDPDGAFERIRDLLGRFAGRRLEVDDTVFRSERDTGDRNRAIAWLLRNHGILKGDVDAALDVYFRQCALLVTARDLAVMGATLAANGVNPVTGEAVVAPATVARTLSVMVSAGMYDYAGEWIYRVGLPAKSGVGGGIVATLPAQFGLGTFSPPLDAQGNSVRGLKVCEHLSAHFGLHLLQRTGDVTSSIAADYDLRQVASRRNRHQTERDILDRHGGVVRVMELAGALNFAACDYIARSVAAGGPRELVVFDLRRVGRLGAGAPALLAALFRDLTAAGTRVVLSGLDAEGQPAATLAAALTGDADTASALRRHATLDEAVEWAEDQVVFLYGGFGRVMESVPLADQSLMQGLSADDLARIARLVQPHAIRTGERIIAAGEPADSVFFLQTGMVSIRLPDGPRLATLGAGTCFGELALLTPGSPRTADVWADTPVTCLRLDLADYDRLRRDRPTAGETILRNLAALLADRLRQANAKIAALSDR